MIGSGPGGYTAAFRAADLGLKTVLIERYDTLGGVCLNVGCIPSKALLHAARVVAEAEEMAEHGIKFGKPKVDVDALRSWKASVVKKLTGGLAGLAKQRKVEVITGEALLDRAEHGRRRRSDDHVRQLHHRLRVGGGDDARAARGRADLLLDRRARAAVGVPKRLLVVGCGIIGLEMATVYDALGSKVTMVELLDQLIPGLRPGLGEAAAQADLGAVRGDSPRHEGRVGRGLREAPRGDALERGDLKFDGILVAIGRRPNGRAVGRRAAGVTVDDAGFIPVDRQLRTNVPNIYAIGDVVGGPMLAHKASHEGKVAAEVIAGVPAPNSTPGRSRRWPTPIPRSRGWA